MRNGILALALSALALFAGAVLAAQLGQNENAKDHRALAVETDQPRYARGAVVAFALRNAGDVALEGTPQVRFLDRDGNTVGALMAAQVLGTLPPGASQRFTWETGDLPAGTYTLHATFAGLEASRAVELVAFA